LTSKSLLNVTRLETALREERDKRALGKV